jgi:hypothetical protein
MFWVVLSRTITIKELMYETVNESRPNDVVFFPSPRTALVHEDILALFGFIWIAQVAIIFVNFTSCNKSWGRSQSHSKKKTTIKSHKGTKESCESSGKPKTQKLRTPPFWNRFKVWCDQDFKVFPFSSLHGPHGRQNCAIRSILWLLPSCVVCYWWVVRNSFVEKNHTSSQNWRKCKFSPKCKIEEKWAL